MHPEIDRFAHIDSPLSRWDPRWKLAALFLLLLTMGVERPGSRELVRWERDLPPALAALTTSLALVLASRIPLGFVLRKLRPAYALLALILLIFPLTFPGGGLYLGALEVSRQGFFVGLMIVLRAVAMILLVFPALGTTRFDASMKALRSLRVPPPLLQIVLFTYRYFFVYADQWRKMQQAARARGFRARGNLQTLRTIGNCVGVLLVGSVERTQRIRNAMISRGASGAFETLVEFRTRAQDVALFALVLLAGGGLLAWRLVC
jgi:cobalt/nickel transport system permease protein